MEANGRTPAQGDVGMAPNDWRSGLSAEFRQRILNKIIETLEKVLPVSGPEGAAELHQTAARFEERIYTSATSLLQMSVEEDQHQDHG